jgi:hypothetical protein
LEVEELAGVGVPTGELRADGLSAFDPEAPIRHRCIETGVVGKDIWGHVARFDTCQEAVDDGRSA